MEKTMEKIVALAKSRGFVYPGSEIYGGLANTWDYGNLGSVPESSAYLILYFLQIRSISFKSFKLTSWTFVRSKDFSPLTVTAPL